MTRNNPTISKNMMFWQTFSIVLIILSILSIITVSAQDKPSDNEPPKNLPPVSNPMLDYNVHPTLNSADVLDEVHFIGDESYDPNPGDNITYFWDFGDGEVSNESSPNHVYKRIGVYTVKLTVNDSQLSDTNSIKIIIVISQINHEPIARILLSGEKDNLGNNLANVNEPIYFNATESYDPDGFPLTYEWDFGDGNTGSGENIIHEYTEDGTYTIILKVIDKDSLDSKDIIEIIIGTGESKNNNKKDDNNQDGTSTLSMIAIGITVLIVILLV
jgi:hypothetical protein